MPPVGRRAAGDMSVWWTHHCMQFTVFSYSGDVSGTPTQRQFQRGAKSVRVL